MFNYCPIQPKNTDIANASAYAYHFMMLMRIALIRYKWSNMPLTVNTNYLEHTLINLGSSLFFVNDIGDYYTLEYEPEQGVYDVYGIPVYRTAISHDGQMRFRCDDTNSVIIFNSVTYSGDLDIITYHAKRLSDIDLTITVNCFNQKTPILLSGNKETELSLRNIMDANYRNEPYMILKDSKNKGIADMSKQKREQIDLRPPFVADKMLPVYLTRLNQAFSDLGINSNPNANKKDRLVSNEVDSNIEQILAARDSGLIMRKDACDKINYMFDLNVSVEFNPAVDYIAHNIINQKKEGADE